MIKACLFDLDGVVLDTEALYTRFWAQVGVSYIPHVVDFASKIKGQTLTEILNSNFADQKEVQMEIIALLNLYEEQMQYEYVKGLKDFVKKIRSCNIKTAIVTSSNKAKMDKVYKQLPEFKSFFDIILTSEDFTESKPSPNCYLTAAQRLQVDIAACVVFEDSINGLISGKTSGARLVGLSTSNPTEAIERYTDEVIPDFVNFNLF